MTNKPVQAAGEPPDPTPMAVRRRGFVSREIERAALGLFVQHGYDNVSVLEIAAAAGVSRRTFFRHFASKRDVLLARDARFAVRLVEAFKRRPVSENAARALCNTYVDVARMQPEDEPGAVLASRIALEAQRSAFAASSATITDELTRLVAERLGADPRLDPKAETIVLATLGASRAATRIWSSRGADRPLTDYLQECFAPLLDGFDPGPGAH